MKYILLLAGTLMVQHSMAQQKKFTLPEAVNGLSSTLAVKNLKQLQWMGNSNSYAWCLFNDSEKCVLRTRATDFVTDTLLKIETLNTQLGAAGINTLNAWPALQFRNEQSMYFQHENRLLSYSIDKDGKTELRTLAKLPEDADPVWIDTSKMSVCYVSGNNLYAAFAESGFVKITDDGSEDIVYGKPVHRDEFGIDRGCFWSPKGNYLAFYRMDQSMVEKYPVVNWNTVPATVKNVYYPFAGRTSHQVNLGVYNCRSGQTIYLQTGEPKDQYLTSVTWSPDEKWIYVALLNRAQNHVKLNRYDAQTGEFQETLLEEKNDRYVEPQHPIYFAGNKTENMIWWSQRSGFMHLYLIRNGEVKQLTSGNWLVNEILGYQEEGNELFFTGTRESPMQKNVYAVNLKTAAIRLVSTTLATHTAQLSSNGQYLIDVYTSGTIPRNIEVVQLQSKNEKRIFTAPDPLAAYERARVEDIKLYTTDSTLLYGKLVYPMGFNPSKKYPAIVYLYNGPHVQLNKDTYPYSGNLWYEYMAQKGYFVFVVDGRGSSNRGFEFESIIHRRLGTVEMDDQLLGVQYLKGIPQIDTNRLGVHGWSFGGFMTTSLMLRHPGVFACAVAGGPVLDWSMYEVMYTERYMDTPEENPEGYKNNLLLDKVKNLKGKLLMIHGTDDDVVVWEHSLKFIKKSVDEGVQVDYFVYPGHPHNVRGKDRVHLMQKISDYFDLYLLNPSTRL